MKKIKNSAIFIVAVLTKVSNLVSNLSKKIKNSIAITVIVAIAVLAGHSVSAQVTPIPVNFFPLTPLSDVKVPEPDNLYDYVKDKKKAIVLGKALFWDMQISSDGTTSCATCHFHAGTDNRIKNQINPGVLGGDTTFTSPFKPNYTLKERDYPFHKLADANDRLSTVVFDTNDVTSSQGIFKSKFVDVVPGSSQDILSPEKDKVFNVKGIKTRQVSPRNAPSVINAVFNFRNFWDGRAQNIFNGVDQFGTRNPNAQLYKSTTPSDLKPVSVQLKNSSLASQAVAPPVSSVEMSGNGRTFEEIGDKFGSGRVNLLKRVVSEDGLITTNISKRLRGIRPLAKQTVDPTDSVLGNYSRASQNQKGLTITSYEEMIKAAFKPEWWQSSKYIQVDTANNNIRKVVLAPDSSDTTKEYTQLEYNLSLFFGLAIQLYESTLISDNAPIDQFLKGKTSALTADAQAGRTIFEETGCIICHGGAEFTAASVRQVKTYGRLSRSLAPGAPIEDTGFFTIGVRPALNDLGVGANDGLKPESRSLSEARLAQLGKFQEVFGEVPNIIPSSGLHDVADQGSFKSPGLRNVELTAPYMHNGGMLTLEQVVDFYNRGAADDNASIPKLPLLGLTDKQKQQLVAFLKALTDERVRYERAPFDHPQLFIPNGHPGDENSVTDDGTGKATDAFIEIPSVGSNGRSKPNPNFLEKTF